jgi:hypothetical protein
MNNEARNGIRSENSLGSQQRPCENSIASCAGKTRSIVYLEWMHKGRVKIMVALIKAGSRGMTCHEIAEFMHWPRKTVGRILAMMPLNLRHMNSERDGQKVIVWNDGSDD